MPGIGSEMRGGPVPPTRYYMAAAHERFAPDELLDQVVVAESARFDGVCCSDHFQPWWEPGESGQAWTWLGAAGALTADMDLGTAVTAPMHRYHPALVAQFIATLEVMNPGRAFLGVGSGEALNEAPLGMDWPDAHGQLERLEEALTVITRLLDGARLSGGHHFPMDGAYLHTRPARRPPIYVSAFHPRAAELAGRLGDGLWTIAGESAPALIDAYRAGADDAGREPGEIILQATFSWARDDDAARAAADVWRATLVPEFFTEDWHDPREMQRVAQREVDDRTLMESFIVAADPGEHIARIREVEDQGATIVVLMNISAADPIGAIETYGKDVLPALRGARV